MNRVRVIPVLLLKNEGLVKTVRFKDPKYIGDPRNAIKIFNEKEVDELAFLDILASKNNASPNFSMIEEIASECFMPLCYGGGIRSIADIKKLFNIGVEKVSLNTSAYRNLDLVREASAQFGSQSIIASIDVKRNFFGKYEVFINSGIENIKVDPVQYAVTLQEAGAGEILLNSIDRDGTMKGYDLDLINSVVSKIDVPLIACGGAGSIKDLKDVVQIAGASAVAAGSLFIYHGKHNAVLINYPKKSDLDFSVS